MAKSIKKIRIFSALEVANLCGVVNQTAINWIRNGYLKAFTTPGGQYRIYAEDLLSFLDSRGMRVPVGLEERFKEDVDWAAILVVDDDAELNDLLKRWFSRKLADFAIHQAFDGFEAGRLLAEKRPGFVVLDIDLPGVDGHALCRRIKEDPGFGKPFIIAMTGLDRPEEAQAMLAEGADAFFAKPLDFDAVAATVAEFAAKAKAKDATKGLILVVEDEDSIRLSLRDYLTKKGYEILVASDGVGALKQLLDFDVDLIVSDYRMDVLGGDYWIKFLRKYCGSKRIIITSGFLRPDFEIPFDVVYKPFDYQELEARIAALLEAPPAGRG